MSGVIPSNLKEKRYLYLKPFSWSQQTRCAHTHARMHAHTHARTHTHTNTRTRTHDDGIRQNAMRCISPKNEVASSSFINIRFKTGMNSIPCYQTTLSCHPVEGPPADRFLKVDLRQISDTYASLLVPKIGSRDKIRITHLWRNGFEKKISVTAEFAWVDAAYVLNNQFRDARNVEACLFRQHQTVLPLISTVNTWNVKDFQQAY